MLCILKSGADDFGTHAFRSQEVHKRRLSKPLHNGNDRLDVPHAIG